MFFFLLAVGGTLHTRRALRLAQERTRLVQENLYRLQAAWNELPQIPPPTALVDDPVAADLDLIGRPGVFDLLGATRTAPGRRTLGRWLLSTPTQEHIQARQAAVAELSGQVALRFDLQHIALPLIGAPPRVEGFLKWAADQQPLPSAGTVVAALVLTLASLATFGLSIAGGLSIQVWLVVLVFVGGWSLRARARWWRDFSRCEAGQRELERYAGLLERFSKVSVDAPVLHEIRRVSGSEVVPALRSLARWIGLADMRRAIAVYPALQALLMWDFFVHTGLQRWRLQYGAQVPAWLEAIGDLDALLSLAELHHDHPRWTVPEWSTDGRLVFEGLAHPLLPQEGRVANDVRWKHPEQILLVTGSNMSGKSTLLRAVGVNLALAMAGAPICADAARIVPVRIGTSVRVQDSLGAGVSFFLAELHRARDLVFLARQARDEGTAMIYLLDEILKGTNARERRAAVVRILSYFRAAGAYGMITTHDLDLAREPELQGSLSLWYLPESVEEGPDGPEMVFARTLTPGLSPTTNAARLLAALVPEEEVTTAR